MKRDDAVCAGWQTVVYTATIAVGSTWMPLRHSAAQRLEFSSRGVAMTTFTSPTAVRHARTYATQHFRLVRTVNRRRQMFKVAFINSTQ